MGLKVIRSGYQEEKSKDSELEYDFKRATSKVTGERQSPVSVAFVSFSRLKFFGTCQFFWHEFKLSARARI